MMKSVMTGLFLLVIVGGGPTAKAASATPALNCANWHPTPEERKQLAKIFEQMADCLSSAEQIHLCHNKMSKDLESFGKTGCVMTFLGHSDSPHFDEK